MELKLWQVDAFADKPFEGNPAAIVPLEAWLPDGVMQAIAAENNLSETAFIVPEAEGRYALRWFTPETEVPLCGHATLASAHVVFAHLAPQLSQVEFSTQSGILTVERGDAGDLAMSLPAYRADPHPEADGLRVALHRALGIEPGGVYSANYPMAVFEDAASILGIDARAIADVLYEFGKDGIIVTAPGGSSGFDFVSRFFAPGKGVAEDPVTGSAHAALVPFWAKRLGKTNLIARQVSARGGTLICEARGERVLIRGKVAPYLEGLIRI